MPAKTRRPRVLYVELTPQDRAALETLEKALAPISRSDILRQLMRQAAAAVDTLNGSFGTKAH